MKAAVINEFGPQASIQITELPTPTPNDHEVQIAAKYASLNPVDWKIKEGYLKSALPYEFPIILGWDVSGIISKVGKNVHHWQVGDEVFAFCKKPLIRWGSFADYVCVEEKYIAYKPKNLSFAQSACIPLTGLTAWQCLFDKGDLKEGEVLLIHAGAGGVGSLAIQFAKHAKATCITTASAKNHSYVKALGADIVIDYTKEDFVERIKQEFPHGIDLVLDSIAGDVTKKSFEVIKNSGRLVSILQPELSAPRSIKTLYVSVQPNGEQLKKIAHLIEQGEVIPQEMEEFPLKDIEHAVAKIRSGHVRGKIVFKI